MVIDNYQMHCATEHKARFALTGKSNEKWLTKETISIFSNRVC